MVLTLHFSGSTPIEVNKLTPPQTICHSALRDNGHNQGIPNGTDANMDPPFHHERRQFNYQLGAKDS